MTLAVPDVARSPDGMLACSWVAEPKVVTRSEPFQRTFEPDTKLLPVTVNVKEGPPALPHEGLTLLTAGSGFRISNDIALERLPSGLNTVTATVPDVARSPDGMLACSWVAEPKVVTRSEPFQRTFEPDTKLLPVTVNVKEGPPAGAKEGLRPVTAGKVFPFTSPPSQSSHVPGLTSDMPAEPPEGIRLFTSVLVPKETPFLYAVRTFPLIASL